MSRERMRKAGDEAAVRLPPQILEDLGRPGDVRRAYAYHLTQAHAFLEGNKRIAATA
jgi:hypothetical protein